MSNQAHAVIGKARSKLAAAIMARSSAWGQYAANHAPAFEKEGLDKFVAVNAEGIVVARNSVANAELATAARNANGTVRHEDFLAIQETITAVRRRRLNGIADLEAAGLAFPADIMTQLVGFENVNEFQEAKQEQNPNTTQNNDTVFTEDFVPLPITHSGFSVPWRQQGFAYKQSLGAQESVRQVSERLEDTLFNGNTNIVVSFSGSNFPIYGYTTHPNRGTGTISDWTVEANRDKIINELIAEIGAMRTDQGDIGNDSVMVYLANDVWAVVQNDYNSSFPTKDTIIERMKKIAEVKDVKPAEKLASTQVVLVEMEARTIQLAKASDIIAVPHTKTAPFEDQAFTTYAGMVHQIKSDSNSKTGIRHLTV